MPRSPLLGRRIHIAGSVPEELDHASSADVVAAREVVAALTTELIARGATFVVPIDKENIAGRQYAGYARLARLGDHPYQSTSPAGGEAVPLAIAVQHHKTEERCRLISTLYWTRCEAPIS